MSKYKAVGIDLGTTYSAMAWVDETGHSSVVQNIEGDMLTPSVVLFEEDRILVGREAKKLGVFDGERMIECAKREIGNPLYSRPIMGHQLPPEVIQAFILKKMKNDLVAALGENLQCVITVPAFFDEPRRKATMDAAQIAGLHVLDIVNEPTAAAIAYGEELGYLKDSATSQGKMYVLVFDLGGGTFDCTLIEMQAGNLRTVATDGDFRLGGRDWDQSLVDMAAKEFTEKFSSDPREDYLTQVRLLAAAEETKHTLSVRNSSTMRVSHAGEALEVRITREEFEEETAHLLERTAYVARQLLTTAGLTWPDLGRILLVGGSTRMPMVSQMLRDRTGIEPEHSVNPDEAVARGAALFADYLMATHSDSARKPSFKVTNVNSHSLGIEGVDQQTGRKRNNIIIPRNSQLPAKKTEKFVTRNKGQKSVVVRVLEGESPEPTECSPIGRTVIRSLPADLPAGWPIMVTYEYGTNGRLNVTARLHGTEHETKLELEREGSLSNTMMSKWANLLESGCGLGGFEEYLSPQAARNRAAAATAAVQSPPQRMVPAQPQPSATSGNHQSPPAMAPYPVAAVPQAPAVAQPVQPQYAATPVSMPQQPQPVAQPVRPAPSATVQQPQPATNHQMASQPMPQSSGLSQGKLLMLLGLAMLAGMLLVGLGIGAYIAFMT